MTGGEGYAQRHLQQSDYYDQNRTVEGKWCGRGAELLGLKGEVTSEDFEAVRQGLDPQTGEFLRQRYSADRIASNGAEQSKARSLYDMTFSAPKSVSVMAIVGGDERLIAAHGTACVQTDMRAHLNPTRQRALAQLAELLAARLATGCPSCAAPGWGVIASEPGLRCESCARPTSLTAADRYGCASNSCRHQGLRPRDGAAPPASCGHCNP